MASVRSSPRRRGLKERLAGLADNIGQFAEVVGNVVSSAGELLVDTDLRRKGAEYIVHEATKNVNEIREGIEERAENLQQNARARLGAGAQRVTGVLRSIERQIQDFQKQQQQRDLQSELEHHHKLPVDIQIGDQVLEDMPQEMRSRLWYVLLESPDMAQALMKRHNPAAQAATGRASDASVDTSARTVAPADINGSSGLFQPPAAPAESGAVGGALSDCSQGEAEAHQLSLLLSTPTESSFSATSGAQKAGCNAAGTVDLAQQSGSVVSTPADATGATHSAADHIQQPAAGFGTAVAASSCGTSDRCSPDIEERVRQSTSVDAAQDSSAAVDSSIKGDASPADGSGELLQVPAIAAAMDGGESPACAVGGGNGSPLAASPWAQCMATSADTSTGRQNPPVVSSPNPLGQSVVQSAGHDGAQTAPNSNRADVPATTTTATTPETVDNSHACKLAAIPPAVSPPAAAVPANHAHSTGEEWEMVPADVPAAAVGARQLEAIDSIKALVQQLPSHDCVDAAQSAQQTVLQAMLEVPWIPGEGVPQEIDEHGEYARLLAAGCGHVEDIISRDVARTFPEHPLFSAQLQGQQRLLRLLKAYAAADPEVGYCQGMAFAAGVLLMYLPEEPAYRLYHRIMTSGPTLRRYYLPGLETLKIELRRFELLLAVRHPQLHQHLLDAGLPALLYAAQWFMTMFSCPFPLHVAARVLDILLQSDSDAILPQLGLAVMGTLQDTLLQLDDFEALITYLKVQPLSWPVDTHRQVINAALIGPASEAELKAAAEAAAAEAAMPGRFSSFSSTRVSRLDTRRPQHEPEPAITGPCTAAAAAASGDVAAHAVGTEGSMGQHCNQRAEAAHSSSGQQQTASTAASSSSPATQPRGSSGRVRLEELDSAFLDLDLDMIMPAVVLDDGLQRRQSS